MPFVKLDCGIVDSSLWAESPTTRVVFLTVLAMCEPDGLCRATAPGLSRRANLPIDDVRDALAILEAPDKDDRSQVEEGRRIVRCEGGYRVVNYLHYRDKDYTAAQRMRELRARKRQALRVTNVTDTVTLHSVTQAEA